MTAADRTSPILANMEAATSRWIREAVRRRAGILLAYLALIAIGNLLGARFDTRTFYVFLAWLGANFVVAPWAARPASLDARQRRYAWTIAMDVAFLGAAYWFLHAAQWLGIVFFVHSAFVAGATLPKKLAIAIGVLIAIVFSALVWSAIAGFAPAGSPLGLSPALAPYAWACTVIVSGVGVIAALMLMESRFIGIVREVEAHYLTIVQAAPDMVMTFDRTGHFLEANPATLEQSGYSWDEIRQVANASFFPPEDWPKVMEARRRSLAGEVVEMEFRYVRRSGEVRWIQTRSASFRRRGEERAVVVIARDVTDARRHAEAAREREERFRLILAALDLGVYTTDVNGRVVAMYGRWAAAQAARGRTFGGVAGIDNVTPEIAALHRAANRRAMAGEANTCHWTLGPPVRSSERYFRTHVAPLTDADGTVVGVAGVWVDETDTVLAAREREALLARLSDAERSDSLGNLVSGVAHELNNPLAAILNFTEDLLAEARTSDERGALEVIQAQALRSRTIVRDLLTFARQGDGRSRRLETPGPILETLVRGMTPGVAAQGVSLTAEVAEPDTPLRLDRAGFEQVVTNLLTNAAQSAGVGGSVRLVARRVNGEYEVIVEDDGAGIPAEHLARIFEPFFTTKATGQGVGLGLSVSLGIVQAHDGTLVAENIRAAGADGARFTMRLPIGDGEGDRPRTPAGGVDAAPRTGRLLIIDDEESIRMSLKRFFERRGWNVECAANGTDGFARLQRADAADTIDVVLCDMKMPGMSGPALFGLVQPALPVLARRFIFATGDTRAPEVAEFLETAGQPVLEKPFELRALEELALRVRGQPRASSRA